MKCDLVKTLKELAAKHGVEDRVVEVEIDDGPPCEACGFVGAHYCTGGQKGSTIYKGVRKKSRIEDPFKDQKSDYGGSSPR